MTGIFTKDFWRPSHLRTTWEYKTIAFLMRMAVAFLVLGYLAVTSVFVWPWMQATYARSQSPQHFEALIEQAIKTDDFNWPYRWIKAQPSQRMPLYAQTVETHIGDIPPLFLSVLVQASRQTADEEKTHFWLMYTQYRMRFDLIRCGQPDLIERYGKMQSVITMLQDQPDELDAIRQNPKATAALLQQVLDYDATHPARNTPTLLCKSMAPLAQAQDITPLPQETWATIRHTLRLTTEQAIREMTATPESKAPHGAP